MANDSALPHGQPVLLLGTSGHHQNSYCGASHLNAMRIGGTHNTLEVSFAQR